ncbi:SusC/RagA family TonB-linked outer membrane protein [Sinomicrobium pectinilyticum]|uniref:SusC/RagA family TonB-linked outer membrane protein n=2 Tax=Sinomicrobium pectinilyticum TaxID=1084421 RepID=A0A3N0ERL4_SINP1|nr:SusC/RagA family TonB-linked outer membrane protein [Sinomicrobium pectinilyticum]
MKLTVLLFFIVLFQIKAGPGYAQNEKITLHLQSATALDVIREIEATTEYKFFYSKEELDASRKRDVRVTDEELRTVLQKVFTDSGMDFRIMDKQIVLTRKKPNTGQLDNTINRLPQQGVSGMVSDISGPIPGVTVLVKGTRNGTITDTDGEYVISVSPPDTLQFSYIGYKTQEVPVLGRNRIDITLEADITDLEVVTINTGYYTTTEKERTGSISSISSEDIEKQPINNALEAMQGRMPGVDIVQSSGVPGGGFEVRIRGQNSIMAGNEPLYIIDGVPYESAPLSSYYTSGPIIPDANISPLNAISPEAIASIEVLKDADATAIYGSRGSNGVILITTKKGKQGKTRFTINSSTGIAHIANKMDLLNTEQYLEMRREAFANDGITDYPANAYDVNGTWDQNRYTDWQEELIGKTAFFRKLQSSISGGNQQTQFLVSGVLQEETTVFPDRFKYDRLAININLNHKDKGEKFGLVFSTGYTLEKNNLPDGDYISEALSLAPNAPALYDEKGNLNWENSTWGNPLARLDAKYSQDTKSLISNMVLSYKFLKSLEGKVNAGYGFTKLADNLITPHTIYNPAFGLDSGSSTLTTNEGNRFYYIVEPQLHWEQQFKNGRLSMLIGTTFQQQVFDRTEFIGFGFANNSLIYNLGAANTLIVLGEDKTTYRYHSLFARVNYSYKDKLFLNLTGRRDGSSRFGPDNRYGNFGAVGAAWLFSEDLGLPWLNYGKLRGSYGLTGNDQIGDYQYLQTYTIGDYPYDGNIGLDPARLYNPNFKWEENVKKEAALELGIFDQKLSFSLAYYNNRSSNQLISYALPGTTGFPSILTNLDALVENSGWEFELGGDIVRNEHFKWNTSVNLTLPKNRLLEFPGLEESTYANKYVIGEPLSIAKLYKLNGVNPETGLFEFEDFNGDGLITNPEDRQYIADLSPKFFGGLSNTVNYKNWSFDVFFQFTKKNGYNQYRHSTVPGYLFNKPVSVMDRWQQPGDEAAIQRFTSGADSGAVKAYSQFTQSSGIISDASFVRLKSLELAYSLSLGRKGIDQCRIALQGQNLFTITKFKGIDPEQTTTSIPILRRVNLGVQVKF